MIRWWLLAALLLPCPGCLGGSTGPDLADADLRVLYIGNSLTFTNDLPGLVQALAAGGGRSASHVTIARPDFSLEDHWARGVASEIRRLRPDVVVMQQGPSSLPTSREHLVHWSGQIAAVGREVGAEPALFMVWPDASRLAAFPDVAASYAAAAAVVSGRLLPAGGTWLEAWELEPELSFYGPDGFHPSYLGSLAAAFTIYAVLFEADPATIPGLDDGVPDHVLATLRAATAAAVDEAW